MCLFTFLPDENNDISCPFSKYGAGTNSWLAFQKDIKQWVTTSHAQTVGEGQSNQREPTQSQGPRLRPRLDLNPGPSYCA